MQKTKYIFILITFIFIAHISAQQDILNNPYLKKSQELQALADSSYDIGEYELAIKYSQQAKENAEYSDKLIAKMLAKTNADKSLALAKDSLSVLKEMDAETNFETEYLQIEGKVNLSEKLLSEAEFDESVTKSTEVISEAQALQEKIAESSLKIANSEYERLSNSKINVSKTVLAEIKDKIDSSQLSYDDGSWLESYRLSNSASKSLALLLGANVVVSTSSDNLPAEYTVVLREPARDCFWRIAGYSFIYNNPWMWKILYNANKDILIDPNNPDIIEIGQVLKIPSLEGEDREGLYDPSKKYKTFKSKQ